jgi:hypothetical protein
LASGQRRGLRGLGEGRLLFGGVCVRERYFVGVKVEIERKRCVYKMYKRNIDYMNML